MKFVRLAGSTLLALLTSGILAMVVQAISNILYPLPEGIDTSDLDALKKHISTLPAGAFGLVLLSYVAGTTAGSWVGVRSSAARSAIPAWILVGLNLLAGIANMVMIPHPPLFMAACLAVFPICGYLGIRLGRRS
ncbi:MAG: hypothetical protein JNL58_02020 [Planctomyces sp.]|nr:hypothetical protein [Planctomyces sp.]